MVWRTVSMLDERKQFILKAINPQRKISFIALCHEYNISPKTGYKWLNRFLEDGEKGLLDLSKAPITNSKKISSEVKNSVISIRNQYPSWGPKKIHVELQSYYSHLKLPSEGSIGIILKENNLSNQRIYRRHVAKTCPLKDCQSPNDTWAYDFKGWFRVGNGDKCEPLTITDGFSRFLFQCIHMPRKRGIDVWSVLERTFYEFGLPLRIRSDNGPPFASLSVGRLSNIAVKIIKIGVTPEWIKPGCPQENGRHERFHLTLKKELAQPPALNLSLQQEKFNQFKNYYNNKRYHEALGQRTPAAIYMPSTRIWDGKLRNPEYSNEYEKRKVSSSGHITWKGKDIFISEVLKNEYVGITEIKVGEMGIYYGPILLGKFNLNKGFVKE